MPMCVCVCVCVSVSALTTNEHLEITDSGSLGNARGCSLAHVP